MADDPFSSMGDFLARKADGVKRSKSGVKKAAQIYAEALKSTVPYNPADHSKYGHLRDNIAVEEDADGYKATFGDAFWYRIIDKGAVAGKKGSHAVRALNLTRRTWSKTQKQVFEAMEQSIK